MYPTTIEQRIPNAGAWLSDATSARSFQMIEDFLAALPPIEELWASLPNPEAVAQLQQRERLLGVATLSWRSISLLHEIISAIGVLNVIWRHAPSLRAAEKQVVLDARRHNTRVLVNKTLTVRLGTMYLLCTGIGDFMLNRNLLSAVAHKLCLPKRIVKDCQINPADYSPEDELGLLTGMVSPFLSPGVPAYHLHAVTLLTETAVSCRPREQMVAISLSPFESLLVPLAHFCVLAHMYARRAYPALRWVEIEPHRAIHSSTW